MKLSTATVVWVAQLALLCLGQDTSLETVQQAFNNANVSSHVEESNYPLIAEPCLTKYSS